jgi:hypothetical protein
MIEAGDRSEQQLCSIVSVNFGPLQQFEADRIASGEVGWKPDRWQATQVDVTCRSRVRMSHLSRFFEIEHTRYELFARLYH